MGDFLSAMQHVMVCETGHADGGDGAYTNRKGDLGGPTKWGISLNTFLKKVDPLATEMDVRNMSRAAAFDLYRRYFWQAIPIDQVIDQVLATKIMEMRVNLVAGEETKVLQHALNDCGENLDVDGIFGPMTLEAANRRAGLMLLGKIIDRLCDHYHAIVAQHPSQAPNLNGWLARAAWPLGHGQEAA